MAGIGDIRIDGPGDLRTTGVAAGEPVTVTVTPDPAVAIGRTNSPAVVLGPVTITPSAASAIGKCPDPSVTLGPVTVVPMPAVAIGKTNVPPVSTGGVVVIPSPAKAVGRTIDPTVILGAITVTPAAAVAIGRTNNPPVTLGPVTVVPAPATAVGRTINPYIPGDPITVTPLPAKAIGRTVNPPVTLGPIVVVPDAARAVGRTVPPEVVGGAVIVIPNPARAIGRTSSPVIVPPRLYGAIEFKASLVTDRAHRETLTITEKTARRLKIELFDENDLPVDGFAITRALFWVIDKTTGMMIRGGTPEEETPDIYPGENFRGLFSSDGKIEILLTATDNRILSTHPRRMSEIHIVSFDIQVASRSDVLPLRAEKFVTILNLRSVA